MGIFDKFLSDPNPNFYKIEGKGKGFVLKNEARTKQHRFEPVKKKSIFDKVRYNRFTTDASKPAGPKKAGKKTTRRLEY